MSEEFETSIPTHAPALGGESHEPKETQITHRATISIVIFAVIAAISTLMAGHAANEAMSLRIDASDSSTFYATQSIQAVALENKIDLLNAMKKKPSDLDLKNKASYLAGMDKATQDAKNYADDSETEMHAHTILSRAVTLFLLAIALAAMATISQKRLLWLTSLSLGALGTLFFLVALL